MKLILSSCDFLNENSTKVILANLDKDIKDCKILFIPNEKATYEKIHSDKYYRRVEEYGFARDNIYIFDESNSDEFRNLDLDVIYVGGGNTFATIDKIRKCNFDKDIVNYINNGTIYIGGSCGAHILTKNIKHLEIFDDNYVGVTDFDALGLFDGIIIPHCGCLEYHPELREELYAKLISENKYNVYKLTNDESLLVNDGNIKKM